MSPALSLHHLGGSPQRYTDVTGGVLDADAYSRMKHGDTVSTSAYGAALAQLLITDDPGLVTTTAPVLLPVAYRHVPPACYHLAQAVAGHLSTRRTQRGRSAARVVKIEKNSVTKTDYATATQAARAAELASLSFMLTEPVHGAHLVLVDDVRVTGSSESAALSALEGAGFAQLTTVYIATLHESLAAYPQIESVINHASVTTVMDMAEQIRSGNFALTIRFLKRALTDPQLPALLELCDTTLVTQMLDGARASGAAFQEDYAAGIAVIARALAERQDPGAREAVGAVSCRA